MIPLILLAAYTLHPTNYCEEVTKDKVALVESIKTISNSKQWSPVVGVWAGDTVITNSITITPTILRSRTRVVVFLSTLPISPGPIKVCVHTDPGKVMTTSFLQTLYGAIK